MFTTFTRDFFNRQRCYTATAPMLSCSKVPSSHYFPISVLFAVMLCCNVGKNKKHCPPLPHLLLCGGGGDGIDGCCGACRPSASVRMSGSPLFVARVSGRILVCSPSFPSPSVLPSLPLSLSLCPPLPPRELAYVSHVLLPNRGMVKKACPRLRDTVPWFPLAVGEISCNLGPIILPIPV